VHFRNARNLTTNWKSEFVFRKEHAVCPAAGFYEQWRSPIESTECPGRPLQTKESKTRLIEAPPEIGRATTTRLDVEQAPTRAREGMEWLWLLWGHRRLLARAAVCAIVISTLVAFLIPAQYDSTSQLMPPDSQSSGLVGLLTSVSGGSGGGASLGGVASDLLGLKSTSDTFVGILQSRTVQDHLIQQFDLQKLYSARRMEDARKSLAARTAIAVDRKSQIISITVTDKSPQRAAQMTAAYVEELNRLVAQLSTSSARRERIFLEGRLQGVSHDLEESEKEFSQFASKNTAIDIKEQGKAMVEAAATLQGQLIAAQSEYEGLKQIYTDNNVRVRSVKARIDELEHQLEKLGGKGESASTISVQPGDSMYPSIRKLPLLGVEYADLYRQTKIQETVLETLTKEYELAKVQEAKEIPTVKVLDVANIPDKKSSPHRLLIILLGTALVFSGTITWVFGNTIWGEIDSRDTRKVLAREVFSTVSARLPLLSRNGLERHLKGRSFWRGRRNRVKPEDSD
jgi:capsule polysaccharide export protein KpsE/RkpR